MKKFKTLFCLIFVFVMAAFIGITGSACLPLEEPQIISIEKTATNGLVDTYTITLSNGETSTFSVTNGKNGTDGEDGEDFSVLDAYNAYVAKYGDIEFDAFLDQYLTVIHEVNKSNIEAVNACLQSSFKVYSEFTQTTSDYFNDYNDVAIYTGSAVIYKMNSDYSYIITNYHVVYNADANADNGSKIARKIVGYIYGSESYPIETSQTDSLGYTLYNYGSYGVEMEYIGGSIVYDLALLKARTSDILAVNENAKAVTFADTYHVGETAIAIGNPEDEGISVTEGIVSVDNEYIALAIDGVTTRSYRSIRIDTALYSGNSGGGLFNSSGKLIGITNAGDETDQNVNYAIPLSIVKNVIENILYYYNPAGDAVEVYKVTLGITVNTQNSKYTFDEQLGYGKITEDVVISSVTAGSIADQLHASVGSKIVGIVVNNHEYTIERSFNIADILLNIRANDKIQFKLAYGSDPVLTTLSYTIQNSDIVVAE